jgi:hypothetical protein
LAFRGGDNINDLLARSQDDNVSSSLEVFSLGGADLQIRTDAAGTIHECPSVFFGCDIPLPALYLFGEPLALRGNVLVSRLGGQLKGERDNPNVMLLTQ